MTNEPVEALLRGIGLTDEPETYGDGIHGWRCEHPQIYGRCDCFARAVADVQKFAREVAAKTWWQGVNAQWKHRPIGNRVLDISNPYRTEGKTE
jgi:hypothetical protein